MPPISKMLRTVLLLVAFAFMAEATARADIMIAVGNNPQDDENVLLNTGMTGNPIFGTTNQTGFSVRFSSNEDLTAPAMGQARIEAVDGALTQLTVDIPGATFTSLILNIDAAEDGMVFFTVVEDNGDITTGQFALSGSGENFFTITAVAGQRISSVTFTTDVDMTITDVDDTSQIRIGGAEQAEQPIPEPMTMILFGTGLAGVAASVRRRRAGKP